MASSPEETDSARKANSRRFSVRISRACSLSSTTRARRPATSGMKRFFGSRSALPMPNHTVKMNVLPLPYSLSAQMLPSIISTSFLEMERPRPVPPYFRVVEVSACAKA
jgi:hypothetical protein